MTSLLWVFDALAAGSYWLWWTEIKGWKPEAYIATVIQWILSFFMFSNSHLEWTQRSWGMTQLVECVVPSLLIMLVVKKKNTIWKFSKKKKKILRKFHIPSFNLQLGILPFYHHHPWYWRNTWIAYIANYICKIMAYLELHMRNSNTLWVLFYEWSYDKIY